MEPPSPPPQQNPYMFASPPTPQPRKTGLILVMVCIVLILLAVIGISAYRMFGGGGTGTAGPEDNLVTLYYRDGETVLWDSKNGDPATNASPAFAAYAKKQLDAKYGSANTSKGVWQITTTLDATLQRAARDQLLARKEAFAGHLVDEIAFVAQDATNGQIVSWVGGWTETSKEDGKDQVVKKREPGTLMLPFVYAAYLENTKAANADTQLDDTAGPVEGYPCTDNTPSAQGGTCLYNLDSMSLGSVSVRQALAGVRLVPAMHVAVDTGLNKVLSTAEALGASTKCYSAEPFTQQNEANCSQSAVIGDGVFVDAASMVQGYATLANKGVRAPQTPFVKIVADGETMNDWQAKADRRIREDVANTIVNILGDKDATYSSKIKEILAAPGDARTGMAVGFDVGSGAFGTVQFSSKYVAGLWVMAADKALTGDLEPTVLPITSGWMGAARQ